MEISGYKSVVQISGNADTVVYRAVRMTDGMPIILKMPKTEYPSDALIAKYRHEHDVLHELNLNGVIKVYDLIKHQNRPILVLEDFNAESLADWINRVPFDLETQLKLAIRICECIDEIHNKDVIHRDISPSNILVNSQTLDVKLADFALSTQFVRERQEAVKAEQWEGTLAYLSPEQTGRMNRKVDYRTDIYSFGATLYEMFTEEVPFQAKDPLELVHAHIARNPVALNEKNSRVPEVISDIVLKCLAKNADDRYQSARGLQKDLERCLDLWEETGQIRPFQLGQQDRVRQFHISPTLYARERQQDAIQKAFDRTSQGTTEVVLISGSEGSGKSALISESIESWYVRKAFVGKGTCSPFHQSVPYGALYEALGQVVSTMLELPDEEISIRRDKIHSTLGVNSGLLMGLVPHLEQLLSSKAEPPAMNSAGAKDALQRTLSHFLSVFGDANCPLVLCLDNLQWADEDTLEILKYLLCDEPIPYLLVLGTYLDQEFSDTHALTSVLTALRSGTSALTELALPYLEVVDISALLIDSFQLSEEEAGSLAKLLLSKTHGNPFFVHQMLTDLYQSRSFSFNETSDQWVWDATRIEQIESTMNVVDFMVQRLDSLSLFGRKVLMQAACAGDRFDLQLLAKVCNQDVQTTLTELGESIREGFVERVRIGMTASTVSTASVREDGLVFRFTHPRIRQAAYTQISTIEQEETHLLIAGLLSVELTEEEKEQRGYELADHFLAATDLLVSEEQRVMAAKACLIAGRKSNTTAAFEVGRRYLRLGVDLLPSSAWGNQYELAFPLHYELLRTEFACGYYEETLNLAKFIRARAASTVDQLDAVNLEMNVYTVQMRMSESQRAGIEALRLCGIHIPRRISRQTALREYQSVRNMIGTKTADELLELPDLDDPLVTKTIRILLITGNGMDGASTAFICFKIMGLSLRHGLSADSSIGFFGGLYLINIGRKKEVDAAYELGQLGLRITEKFHSTRAMFNAIGFCMVYLNHWRNHLRTTVKYGELYYELTTSFGSQSFGVMHSFSRSYARLACGDVLSEIAGQALEFVSLSNTYNLPLPAVVLKPLLDTLAVLQDTSGDVGNIGVLPFSEHLEYGHADQVLVHSFLNCMRLYLFDEAKLALPCTMEGLRLMDTRTVGIDFMVPEQTFYHGLILAAVYPGAEETEQNEYKRRLNRILRLMRMWAQGCPDNYLHKSLLLQAEYQRLVGKLHQAADLYDEAIASANEYGFIQNEAIANECAAKFYLARNKPKVARAYLTEARYLYGKWGAFGKVRKLEEKYAHLLDTSTVGDSTRRSSSSDSKSMESGESSIHSLDLSTIFKASQAISSEIQLDRLLSTMLRLVMENVGAEKGYWILEEGGEWSIEASADVNGENKDFKSVSIRQTDKLSFGVVQYAIRTQEVVVLHNACREGRFVRDPHIWQEKAKSVLCFPVVNQGNVIAILYLENNLATHAFTSERVELLKLLSGQAAISIENAKMYENLDRLVRERTDALERTQQQMIESEKMASLGQLTAGVAHEINNPINFVVSSVPSLRRDIDDLMALLKRYRVTVEDNKLGSYFEREQSLEEEMDLVYMSEEIQQLLRGIEDGGKRTAEIVKGLRTFSRLDEDDVKTASVTDGIDSTLTLLKKNAEPRIRIFRDYDDVPDIECYPGKLNQVYMNLLSNAIQAIPGEGEIRISVQRIGDNVRIQITDTGAGMSKEVQRRIFEPFFTTKEVGVGTGLGLSISYGIIERHKGSIEVDSELGKGTTFTLTLPIRQV